MHTTPTATTPSERGGHSKGSGQSDRIPGLADVLRADLGRLRGGFSSPEGRSSRIFSVLTRLLDEKRSRYEMRIIYCPPLNLLWSFLPGDGSPVSFVHKFYCREVWRERGLWARLRLLGALLFVWPVLTSLTMIWFTCLNGVAIKRRTGKGVGRQMVEQLYLAAAHAVLPPWYYMFDLFDDEKRALAAQYLHRFETKGGLFRFLKRTPRGSSRTPLRHKLLFDAWCRDHGVRSAPVLLSADQGKFSGELALGEDGEPRLPQADLFVKPADGRGGFGAERWSFEGEGRWRDHGGAVRTAAELLEELRRRSLGGEACIVQPRLVNHLETADLSNGALSTVRILTIEDERGGFEATHAVLRMAVGTNTTVDNFHAGGIAAKVDLQTGELGLATDIGLRPDCGWCESHPDTHARILGRVLPFWPETLALVQRAHAAFSDRVLIGWDVAILQDGPVIIEGNSGADVDIVQRTHGEPLGPSRFGELIALHLRRALEAEASRPQQSDGDPSPLGALLADRGAGSEK